MRRILLNQARRKARLRHGGGRRRVELDDAEPVIEPPSDRLLDIDRALERLEARDPRQREIVNLRYFAGLTAPETAAALGLSVKTVEVEWTYMKAWLQRELADSERGR
jgi:RNA polymerase sigma factor (TIGR02999 family)